MDLLERSSKMKVQEFFNIHLNQPKDTMSLVNEYNTHVLFSIHEEFHKKISELKLTDETDLQKRSFTEFHLADLQSKIFEKLN